MLRWNNPCHVGRLFPFSGLRFPGNWATCLSIVRSSSTRFRIGESSNPGVFAGGCRSEGSNRALWAV